MGLFFREGVNERLDVEKLLGELVGLIKGVEMEGLFEALEMLLFHARAHLQPYAEALLD